MRNYLWLGVIRNIGQYIEGCDIYQRIKNRTGMLVGKLKLSEILEKPWTYLMVDFIMKSLLVAGKMLWNTLDTNIFLFLLSIFLDFIFLFF